MKKLILSLVALCYATVALPQTNVQKGAGNVLSNGSIVVGNATSITVTGNGTIVATSAGNATSVPWSGVTGTPTTLAGYGVTNTLSTTAPITGGGLLSGNLTLTIPAATGSVNGYLTSADWGTFNAKQPAGGYLTALTGDATATGPGSAVLTLAPVNSNVGTFAGLTVNAKGLVTAAGNLTLTTTAPLTGGGTLGNLTFAMPPATTSANGYLTSTDWNTFNSKGAGSVTSFSFTNANGISGTVGNATTTPSLTLSLGAITPTSVNGHAFSTGTGAFTLGNVTFNASLGGTLQLPGVSPFATATDLSNNFNVAGWGDSLMAGNGGGGVTPLTRLNVLTGFPAYNGGVGGETAPQIAVRMLAATSKYGQLVIFWEGRNGVLTDPTAALTAIASQVAALTTDHYVVLSVINSSTETTGTPERAAIVAFNATLASTYGTHYVDVWTYLLNLVPTGDGTISVTLRSDALHLNATGYSAVGDYLFTNWAKIQGTQTAVMGPGQTYDTYFTPPALGATTPNAVHGTTIDATSTVTGTVLIASSGFVQATRSSNTRELSPSSDGTQWRMDATFTPYVTNTSDLGTTGNRWKAMFLSGGATIAGSVSANLLAATGGFIQATRSSVTREASPSSDGQQWRLDATLTPYVTATSDLGTSSLKWKDLYLSGSTSIAGAMSANQLVATGGFIDATRSAVTREISPASDGTTWRMDATLTPYVTATSDLGTTSLRWRDAYLSGNATIGGNIALTGNATLTNALTVANGGTGVATLTGLVKGNGTSAMTAAAAGTDYVAPGAASVTFGNATITHVIGGGSSPSIAAGTGAGTTPTVSVTGKDHGFTISVTTGTLPTLSATVCTVTFAAAYASAPHFSLTSSNANASLLTGATMVTPSSTTTTFVLTAGATALTGATTYTWEVLVVQ